MLVTCSEALINTVPNKACGLLFLHPHPDTKYLIKLKHVCFQL